MDLDDRVALWLRKKKLPGRVPVPVELPMWYEAGVIKPDQLIQGQWYVGECRNSNLAVWDSTTDQFWYIRSKFTFWFIEPIRHLSWDTSFDVFIPISQVTFGQYQAPELSVLENMSSTELSQVSCEIHTCVQWS